MKLRFLVIGLLAFLVLPGLARGASVSSQPVVVLLKPGASTADVSGVASKSSVQLDKAYTKAIKGFSASVTPAQQKALKKNPKVLSVVADKPFDAARLSTETPQITPNNVKRVGHGTAAITVAVLDTGIDLDHPDLAANVLPAGKNCIRADRNADDDDNHGSHIAGTIAAVNDGFGLVGIAPNVKLIAVKVLNSSGRGTLSQIICGLDWVAANASAQGIKVVNMSLGGFGTSDNNCGQTDGDPLHAAICRVRDAGVTIVAAAGNSGRSVAQFVPAAYDDAVISVSALVDTDGLPGGTGPRNYRFGQDDTFAKFSNYGPGVDIAAPGTDISSTAKRGRYKVMSGTSMSAAHASAAAALYIAGHPGSGWQAVLNGLRSGGEALGAGHTDPSGLHHEPAIIVR